MSLSSPARRTLCAAALLTLALAGCKTAAPTASDDERPFDQAIRIAADGLADQLSALPGFGRRAIVIDPMLEGGSGQQTAATRQMETAVTERLRERAAGSVEWLPFDLAHLASASHVLTGTMTRLPGSDTPSRPAFRLQLALTDLKSGLVVAQASSRAAAGGIDTLPTPYYRDSPVLLKDRVIDGYVRTSGTPPGGRADPAYIERLATAAQIQQATLAYEAQQYPRALELYEAALGAPSGEQLRTLSGIYLANWRLGRAAQSQQAFAQIVAHGIANRSLGVKFLFKPNSTEFWADPLISGPYVSWLREIAQQATAAKVCMQVIGHTSRTGAEAYNDKLSADRALSIRRRLGTESGELLPRITTSGVGYRDNIIGTGTDDAGDALDRRVEFRVGGC